MPITLLSECGGFTPTLMTRFFLVVQPSFVQHYKSIDSSLFHFITGLKLDGMVSIRRPSRGVCLPGTRIVSCRDDYLLGLYLNPANLSDGKKSSISVRLFNL
jgi:hypothetical protein